MTEKIQANFRFSRAARALLKQLAERDGLTETATLEQLVRRAAREAGIAPPPKHPENPESPS